MTSQHQDWMHEAFRDHGLHGHAATREGEFGLRPERARDPMGLVFVVALLAVAGVCAYSAYAPWFEFRDFQVDGISNGRGEGWTVLILSLAVGAALLVALVRRGNVLRTVIATLFVALALEAATTCLRLFAFQPGSYPLTPAWGLLLAVGLSPLGAVLAVWWCARGFRTVALRSGDAGQPRVPPSPGTAAEIPRVPLAGAPTASH